MRRFSKKMRLNKRSDFDRVFEQGRKIVMPHFIFFYQQGENNSRLGLIVPKKKISKAHDRNRMKRLIRESFRCCCLRTIDVVVLARSEMAGVENQRLLSEIGQSWEKMGLSG